ncbi:MAG TPA: hypothetical protein VKZ58_04145 [Longimicrobiales bacterium]|nr:hypothetical protein [Longimicrobiales bacterium]
MIAKIPFVVGRSTRRGLTVVLLCPSDAPIRGPWTIRAVISAN